MAPQNHWSTSKGWAVYFQEMDYSLVESDQHPGCSVSTYFKMQKGTFLPPTFKAFPEGIKKGKCVEPGEAGSTCRVEHHDGGYRRWWVAAKKHPRVPGERCLPGLPCLHLPNTHKKRRKSVERPECAQLRCCLPQVPPVASAGFSSQLQLPTAVWEMDPGLGKQQ